VLLVGTEQKCTIIIATHKKSDMPQDNCYLPIHVGREGKEDLGYDGDNTGDNISLHNSKYSELTGLYWAWKNLNCDFLGLVHYRRHFSLKSLLFRKMHKPIECVLTDDEIKPLLEDGVAILPTKRRYYIETIALHYKNTIEDGENHLSTTRAILSEKCPDYLSAYENVMGKTSAYMFNMFIMPKDLANSYCTWLFDILFELESRIDRSGYSAFDKRYPGRVSEMLLNVWLLHNNVRTKTIGRIDLWKVNWPKKIAHFLAAKFVGRRYKQSF
jgi:hypothetical protein